MSLARYLAPFVLVVATTALAVPSWAADPEAVATAAPAGSGAPPTIAEQIDTYLKTSPAILPPRGAGGVTPGTEPRGVHGVVDVAVGTGGYRSAYVQSDIPVGKTGTLSIAVQDTQFKGRYGAYRQPGVGLGLSLGEAQAGTDDPPCRHVRAPEAPLPDPWGSDARRRACSTDVRSAP